MPFHLLIPIVLALIGLIGCGVTLWRSRHLATDNHCVCGYPMASVETGVCPECGVRHTAARSTLLWQRKSGILLFWTAGVVVATIACGTLAGRLLPQIQTYASSISINCTLGQIEFRWTMVDSLGGRHVDPFIVTFRQTRSTLTSADLPAATTGATTTPRITAAIRPIIDAAPSVDRASLTTEFETLIVAALKGQQPSFPGSYTPPSGTVLFGPIAGGYSMTASRPMIADSNFAIGGVLTWTAGLIWMLFRWRDDSKRSSS